MQVLQIYHVVVILTAAWVLVAISFPEGFDASTISLPSNLPPARPADVPPLARGGPLNITHILNPGNIGAKNGIVRIDYVPGIFGNKSGGSFKAVPPGLPSRKATLSYSLYIPDSFEWSPTVITIPGGKFPGLCFGDTPEGCATGGKFSPTAGSYRAMWRANGQLIGYSYHAVKGDPNNVYRMQAPEFQAVSQFSGTAGTNIWYKNPKDGPLQLVKGAWNTIAMTIDLGTPGKPDGMVSLTCNGKTKSSGGVLFRESEAVKINSVDFVSFAGGGSVDWALKKPTYTLYKDIKFSAG